MSRRPVVLVGLAAACAAAAAVLWIVALGSLGRRADTGVLYAINDLARPSPGSRLNGVAGLADPLPVLLAAIALVGWALRAGRGRAALLVPAVLAGANLAPLLLKPLLAHTRVVGLVIEERTYDASWPSGHASAAMSLALCAVLVAGPRHRAAIAAVGAAYAVAVGYAVIALAWHLPSDVLGGYLVAAAFALLGAGLATALGPGLPVFARPAIGDAPRHTPALALLGALAATGAGAVAVLTRREEALTLAVQHAPALLAGLGVAALGATLTATLALALRR